MSHELVVWEVDCWRPRAEIDVPGSTARVTRETNSTVEIATGSRAPGTLLLRESYDNAWTATVDGNPVAITPTSDTFRQVSVPAGQHTVNLTQAQNGT